MQKKGSYHHGDLRRALVNAALNVIAEEGIKGLTLRKAARRAGVSHAAPAHHFNDLTGLLAAVAEHGFTALMARMEAAVADAPDDPLARFHAVGTAYIAFAAAEPAAFAAMFHPRLADRTGLPALQAASSRPFDRLLECVAECRAAGLLAPGDDRDAALFAWSTVHGLATLLIDRYAKSKGFTAPPEMLADRVTRLVFTGLRE